MDTKMSGNILHHYTNNAGLVGILTSGELWFSDIRLLNDARELHRALDVGEHTISKISKQHRKAWFDAGREDQFDSLTGKIIFCLRQNSPPFGGLPASIPFVFSLSKKHDALSQWRAYGNDGYCVSFDSAKLLEKIRERIEDAKLVEVIYVKENENACDPMVAAYVGSVFAETLQFINEHTGGFLPHELDDIIRQRLFRPRIYNAAFLASYKDYGFHEEEEQRIVIDLYPQFLDNIFFSPNGVYPRTFVSGRDTHY